MPHPLLDAERIKQSPRDWLEAIGRVFAVFDEKTQDSGNKSYGVEIQGERYFVKTAGDPDFSKPFFDYPDRVNALRNAVRLSQSISHSALPRLRKVVESPTGPMLVYDWVDGELVRSDLERVRSLPVWEVLCMLDVVYELHHELAGAGWIASDFYDGCMIYDFERHKLSIVDLDSYRDAPFKNDMGRMFGSQRFMAPEEFEKGAVIDERTTVFTMGRTASVLLSDNTLEREPFRGTDAQREVILRACKPERMERFASMAEFYAAWMDTRDLE